MPKRKFPNLTKTEVGKMNNSKVINRHKFTYDEMSAGGTEARWRERLLGKKLNHGITFGKKETNNA